MASCHDCNEFDPENYVLATVTIDVPYAPYTLHLCEKCESKRQDASEPQTDDWSAGERMNAAYTLDRRLR